MRHNPDSRERLGRIASAAGVAILLLGVPIILTAFRLTPPVGRVVTEIGHPGTWTHLLRNQLSDDAVVKVIAFVAWLAWLWLVLCVLLELVANVRGVPTFRLPGSRHTQSLVAFLIGACLALLPAPRGASHLRIHAVAAAQFQPVTINRVVLLNDRPTPWPGAGVDAAGQAVLTDVLSPEDVENERAEAATSQALTYLVRPGDTLWSIAEERLGSPLRWREIVALNFGRPQNDGRELTDAHWIFPGWTLVLPPGAAPAVSSVSSVPSAFSTPQSDVRQESVRMAFPVEDPPAHSSANGSHAIGLTKASPAHHDPAPIAPIGFGVLGASVVALLERMRRAQQRHRRRGLRITLPDAQLADFEVGLRLGADNEAVEWIDIGQRILSARVRPRAQEPDDPSIPRLVGVRLRSDVVEFLLDASSSNGAFRPTLPPSPFEDGPGGKSWLLPRDPELLKQLKSDAALKGVDVPVPGLVTLGRDEYGLILLDLERAGSLGIGGSQSEQLAQAIAVEMACSKWSDQVDIIVVGLPPDIERLERVVHATSIASVVQRVERRVRERKKLLEIVRHATNHETRWVEGGDAWDLCVVLCMQGAAEGETDALEDLVELAGDGSFGLSVVFCSTEPIEARMRVTADGGPLVFERLQGGMESLGDSTVWPQNVVPNFVESVTNLVGVASNLEGVPPSVTPYGETTTESEPAVSISSSARSASASHRDIDSGEVEVRILGPAEVVGAARPFTRAWALELVVYLAFHKSGASTDKWSTALWPDRLMAPASLHSTASSARRSLGVSRTGEDHLPRSHGRLSLGPGVTTDWDRFVRLSREDAPDAWKEAFELIRGRPFEGLRASDWALLEGITAMIESEVVDLATRCADWFLAHRDWSEAEWVARRALLVSPYDERMYRVIMKSADAAGNPAGVEAVMTELSHLVADDVEPFDAVHPETLELYRSLSRRSFSSRDR